MRSTPINLLEMEKNRIFIKSEDLIPVSFGGNKARKAYNFFKEIDEGSFDYVVTYGSSSSNHCRIIANMSASRNLPCLIISPEEESEKTFNSLLGMFFIYTISRFFLSNNQIWFRGRDAQKA
jgi:D-cysteine desulfhydrase